MEAASLKFRLSDEQLARDARAGCVDSFEELVRRYQVPLMRFLMRRGSSREDAEDRVQESFLRAYQSMERYDDGWPFKTWIFTIGYRLAISYHRNHVRRQPPAAAGEIADGRDHPLERIQRSESRQRIWDAARDVLTEQQFTAMWLYYAEALPAGEVARVMNRSWVWVKTALHRSRRKLRAMLQDENDHEHGEKTKSVR
jgi:RNA polymerase sigma-70 factor, ECF subfamily